MKRKLFLVAGLLVGTLGLASCGSKADFDVAYPQKSASLNPNTPLDVDVASLSESEKTSLVKEQCYKAYNLLEEETLTGNLKTVRDNRKKRVEDIANAKSFTTTCMVKSYFKQYEEIPGIGKHQKSADPMTLLYKSSIDFETGNLYYYEHAYFDSGEEIAKLETKAIREDSKYVVASKIYFAPKAYVIKTTIKNSSTGSTSSDEREVKGELKVKTEIDAANVLLGTKIDAEAKSKVSNIKADLSKGLLFNVQSYFSEFFDAETYSNKLVSVNEDYSTVYVENNNGIKLFENYLLKSEYSIRSTDEFELTPTRITMNYELSDKSVVTDFETDLSDYHNYSAEDLIFKYNQTSVFPLAREPYNKYRIASDSIGYGCYDYPIEFLLEVDDYFK